MSNLPACLKVKLPHYDLRKAAKQC